VSKLYGGQRPVLQAIRQLAWGSNEFITDDQIAKETRIPAGDVRDWIETLEGDGYVDLVRTTDGQSAAITAKGRLALSQVVNSEAADRINMGPVIDLLDETNRLGRDPGRKMDERYLSLIGPIHTRLESVHESYLDHFRKYREMVAGWEGAFGPDHPIFDMLEHDHLFTQSDRIRLLAMTQAIPLFKKKQRRKVIDPASASPKKKGYYGYMSFLTSIAGYFETTYQYGDPDSGWESNLPRGDLLSSLRDLFGLNQDEVLEWVGEIERSQGERFRLGRFEVSGSRSRMQQLRVELAGAGGDPDEIRRALALTKIDEIVATLLKRFEQIAHSYEWIKANQLLTPGMG
jgi:hypothetical protein